jgi:hypothetical protein
LLRKKEHAISCGMYMNQKFYAFAFLLISGSAFSIQYSTNFMWTNESINNDNQYVFPTVRKKPGWDINVVDWMRNFLRGNPEGDYRFWYNKKTVTPQQIKNTESLFKDLRQEFGGKVSLVLRDTNDLALVKASTKIFTDPRITYTKVDLLRLIAALDYLEGCGKTECVFIYADVDNGYVKNESTKVLEPLSLTEENLFYNQEFQSFKKHYQDTTTPLDDLKRSGIIMRMGENSFFMISNHQPAMLQAIRTAVVEPMIMRTQDYYQPTLDKFEKEFGISPFSMSMVKKHRDNVPKDRQNEVTELFRSIVNETYECMVTGPMASQFLSLKGELKLDYDATKYTNIAEAWRDQVPFIHKEGLAGMGDPKAVIKLPQLREKHQLILETVGGLDIGGSDSQSASAAKSIF